MKKLLWSISSLAVIGTSPIPGQCTLARKEMHCGNENFNSTPFNLIRYDNYESLYMEDNNLTYLDTQGFAQSPYRRSLTSLYYRNNQIEAIGPNTFLETPNVETIDLSNNKLKHINDEFRLAKKLRNLILDGNIIKTIARDAFENNKHLQYLSVRGNCIKNLDQLVLPKNVTLVLPEECPPTKTRSDKNAGDSRYKIGILFKAVMLVYAVVAVL